MSYKERGRNVVHKIQNKLLKNCIKLHIRSICSVFGNSLSLEYNPYQYRLMYCFS